MIQRIQPYDIQNNTKKAWNTLSDELRAIINDLCIVCGSELIRTKMPKEIKDDLQSLDSQISLTLFKFHCDDFKPFGTWTTYKKD